MNPDDDERKTLLLLFFSKTLTRKEREYEHEIAALTSRNVELQRRLSSLKSDLNSEGHDVETWLDNCPEIDYSTSTRTASEAEMYRTIDDEEEIEKKSTINSISKANTCKSR